MHYFILISYMAVVTAALAMAVIQVRGLWLATRPRKGEPALYKPFFSKEPPCQK